MNETIDIIMSQKNPSISAAKEWLLQNPTESIAVAARLWHLSPGTLRVSIARDKKSTTTTPSPGSGGLNKILTKAQIEALKDWIRAQSEQGLGATKKMVYAGHPQPKPSTSWLTKFIKNELQTEFQTIKTKPIALQWVVAQDLETVTTWFRKYEQFIREYGIKGEDIWNMDETGFWIGIPGGQTVIVPQNLTELYNLVLRIGSQLQ